MDQSRVQLNHTNSNHLYLIQMSHTMVSSYNLFHPSPPPSRLNFHISQLSFTKMIIPLAMALGLVENCSPTQNYFVHYLRYNLKAGSPLCLPLWYAPILTYNPFDYGAGKALIIYV